MSPVGPGSPPLASNQRRLEPLFGGDGGGNHLEDDTEKQHTAQKDPNCAKSAALQGEALVSAPIPNSLASEIPALEDDDDAIEKGQAQGAAREEAREQGNTHPVVESPSGSGLRPQEKAGRGAGGSQTPQHDEDDEGQPSPGPEPTEAGGKLVYSKSELGRIGKVEDGSSGFSDMHPHELTLLRPTSVHSF